MDWVHAGIKNAWNGLSPCRCTEYIEWPGSIQEWGILGMARVNARMVNNRNGLDPCKNGG